MSLYRTLIVDDHPIVLSGLKLLLATDHRFDVCGQAGSAAAACAEAERLQPDAVVTDLTMGEGDGLTLIEDLRAVVPTTRIIVYSSRDERVWAPASITAGAHGYVAKSEPLDTVVVALDRVLAGDRYLGEPVMQAIRADQARHGNRRTGLADLSPRERQILRMAGEGATLQSVANTLELSVKTVGTYRERLKIKLGLESGKTLDRYATDYVAGRLDPP